MALRLVDELDQESISASATARLNIPPVHWLAASELHVDATIGVSSGSVTVVNSTLGIIPLITRIRLLLDGGNTVFDVSGKVLDYWSHIDRPGSERLALSSTTDDDPWDAVLRYEHAQSEANPTGSIPLWLYGAATVEVETGAVTLAGTGTGVAVAGTFRLQAEQYDQRSRFADAVRMASVVHRITSFTQTFDTTGAKRIDLKAYFGELLERVMLLAENSGSDSWGLFDRISLMRSQAEVMERLRTETFRARNLRNYGGDDIPVTGLYVFDRRRAADNDVIPLGDKFVAPDPHLVTEIGSGTSLSSAQAEVIVETLTRVNRDPAALLAPASA